MSNSGFRANARWSLVSTQQRILDNEYAQLDELIRHEVQCTQLDGTQLEPETKKSKAEDRRRKLLGRKGRW